MSLSSTLIKVTSLIKVHMDPTQVEQGHFNTSPSSKQLVRSSLRSNVPEFPTSSWSAAAEVSTSPANKTTPRATPDNGGYNTDAESLIPRPMCLTWKND